MPSSMSAHALSLLRWAASASSGLTRSVKLSDDAGDGACIAAHESSDLQRCVLHCWIPEMSFKLLLHTKTTCYGTFLKTSGTIREYGSRCTLVTARTYVPRAACMDGACMSHNAVTILSASEAGRALQRRLLSIAAELTHLQGDAKGAIRMQHRTHVRGRVLRLRSKGRSGGRGISSLLRRLTPPSHCAMP